VIRRFIFLAIMCLWGSNLFAQYTKTDTIAADAYDFWMAADTGNFEMVKLCVEKGIFVDVAYSDNVTPLMLASQSGHYEIVQYLIGKGANVNAYSESERVSALISAVKNNDMSVAEFLIRKYARLQHTDILGRQALHHAVISGFYNMTDMLLYYDAPVNEKDSLGCSPAYYAVVNGDTAMLQLLMKYGADITERNSNGESFVHIAVQYNVTDMAAFLIHEGLVVTDISNSGTSLIDEALLNGNQVLIKLLLDNGAVLNDSITPYYNSMNLARLSGNRDIKRMVRSKGIKPMVKPYFQQLGVSLLFPFNLDDVFVGLGLDIYDTRYGFQLSGSAWVRPGARGVWLQHDEGVYYQYWEKRWGIAVGVKKHFRIPGSPQFPLHLTLGVDEVFTGGSYKATDKKNIPFLGLSPNAGLYIRFSSKAGMSIGYSYLDLGNKNISPHRVSIGIRGAIGIKSPDSVNANRYIIKE